jgi:hypothetical protein
MTMNSRLEILALPFGLILAIGCGARSPMDMLDQQSAASSGGSGGGYGGGYGGIFGGGGRPNTGGAGGQPNAGGGTTVIYVTGGSGGGLGGQAGFGLGGSTVVGRGGMAGSSSGGSAGGAVVGGRGGTPTAGGTISIGGSAGGAAGSGAGGSVVCSPATPCDGSVGDALIIRDLGADVRDTGRSEVAGTGGIISVGGAIAASGGTVASGGTSGTGGSTCPGLASNEELIDDLNDGDRFIPSVNGRSGAWSDSHDSSPSGKMFPDPNTGFAPSISGDLCRKYAAYVNGTGYVLWGADLWFGLGSPYNASKYKGISFWAKIDAGTSSVVRAAFPDKDTQPEGNICLPNTAGTLACYDHYGYRVTLTSTWTKYTISYSQLAQEGWGHAGTAFDPASLYEILFQIPVGATFGIWIDDIAFTM